MSGEESGPRDAWPSLRGLPRRALEGGLINATFAVGEPPVAVVQRLHPIFRPEVNSDIEAVTARLEAVGVPTPRPIRTEDGGLWRLDEQGRCWRALTWLPGRTHHRLQDARMAEEAGALVGRWHAALAGFEHEFAFSRPGAHDTDAHLASLVAALDEGSGHRLHSEVAPLAAELLERWARWDGARDLPPRLAHGDLKVGNLRFTEDGRGLGLLDLDTMGRLPLDIELGDAWRSWCNPRGEDVEEAAFRLDSFEASVRGYLRAHPVSAEERDALPAGVERICLELASRFAADALRESYFGWNPRVAAGRGEHNLLRARGQLSLARAVAGARAAMDRAIRAA